jgi:DNA-binding transcriptional MocR family regulator
MHYAAKHLTGKATWVNPSSGLFVWFDLSPSGITDSQVQTPFLVNVMVC